MVAYGKGELIITEQHLDDAISDTDTSKKEKSLIQRLFAG